MSGKYMNELTAWDGKTEMGSPESPSMNSRTEIQSRLKPTRGGFDIEGVSVRGLILNRLGARQGCLGCGRENGMIFQELGEG